MSADNVINLCAYRAKLEREEMEAVREELMEYIYQSDEPGLFNAELFSDGQSTGIVIEYPIDVVQDIMLTLGGEDESR